MISIDICMCICKCVYVSICDIFRTGLIVLQIRFVFKVYLVDIWFVYQYFLIYRRIALPPKLGMALGFTSPTKCAFKILCV